MSPVPLPYTRTPLELYEARRHAVEAWGRARRAVDAVVQNCRPGAELQRLQDARRREERALLDRVDRVLRRGEELAPLPVRAVLAHRDLGLVGEVARRLTAAGVQIVGAFSDGADAAGTIVAEQPDLVLVQDALPTMSGLDVLDRVRTFCPDAVFGAQVADHGGIGAYVDAGACAVFTRRVPTEEVAERLLECLAHPEERVAVA